MKKTINPKRSRILSNLELSAFCGQFAMLLSSGIAPAEAVDILLSDTSDDQTRLVLTDIQHLIHTGERFHMAIAMSRVFPPYVISMVRIGEETGNLDEVLLSLSDFYAREDALAESFRSAIMYPMVMIVMIFAIILVMLTKVMPIFSQVFAQLGTGMSAFSQTLLGLGKGLGNWSMVLVVILVILAFLFFYTTQTRAGRKLLSGFGTVIPAIRMLLYDIAASRFAGGMAMAISSGMDTSTSLQLLKNIVENDDVCKKIDKCSKDIAEGADFPEALKSAGIFSNVYTRMVKVGFRAGSMDRILSQIAEMYENQVNKRISSILSVLEPTLVIVLSLIVGLILLSVIIPLMGIMSSIG